MGTLGAWHNSVELLGMLPCCQPRLKCVWLTAPTWLQRLTIAVELVANPSIVFMVSALPPAACR